MKWYPLKLIPQPSERLWGGSRLKAFVPGFETLQNKEPIGEAWLVYAENKIANGELVGQTLQQAASKYGADLLGTKSVTRYGDKVPLLAKFLDPSQWLSIQVHPDDNYALSKEASTGYLGKTETWVVLDAKEGSQIIWGFKQDVTQQQVRDAISKGQLEDLLNYVSVKAGDVIYNPAGTIHALGPDVFIFEIQQSSDLTYRLYDFNRKDSSGKLRELHIDKALEVSSLEVSSLKSANPLEVSSLEVSSVKPANVLEVSSVKNCNAKVATQKLSDYATELVRSEFFVAEKLEIHNLITMTTKEESLELLTVVEGNLQIVWQNEKLDLSRAESVVLPAALGEYNLSGNAVILRCYVP